MRYYLIPIHDGRKSFYNKAEVIEDDGIKQLISYDTNVCEIIEGKPRVYGTYSQTTLRHIKEFLRQNGFKADSKEQILNDYGAERGQPEQDDGLLKSVSMVAKLGEIFGETIKQKNDWKVRMLKAGLEKRGFTLPDDWESLSEEEKEKRLNSALKQIE